MNKVLLAGIIFVFSTQNGWTQYCAEVDFSYQQNGKAISFSGFSKETVTDWFWYFGNGIQDKGQYVRHEFASDGVYEVCLKIIVNPNCTGAVCKKITIGTTANDCELKADFEFKTDNKTAFFAARSNEANASFYWYVTGQNTTYTGKDIRIAFDREGIYEVCLTTVNEAQTCKVQTCKKVEIGKACDLDADFAFTIDANVVKVNAKSTAGDAARYYWDFGDGTGGDGRESKHLYEKSGEYEICLKVVAITLTSTASSPCTKTVCKKIRIGNTVVCELKADFAYKTDGKVITFTGRSNDEGAYYKWYSRDANMELKGKDVRFEFANDGTYEVCLIVTNNDATCRVQVCKRVTVGSRIKIYPNPTSDFVNIASDRIVNQYWVYNQANELKLSATSLNTNEVSIDITTLEDGVYMISIHTDDGVKTTQRFYKKG